MDLFTYLSGKNAPRSDAQPAAKKRDITSDPDTFQGEMDRGLADHINSTTGNRDRHLDASKDFVTPFGPKKSQSGVKGSSMAFDMTTSYSDPNSPTLIESLMNEGRMLDQKAVKGPLSREERTRRDLLRAFFAQRTGV